MTSDSRPEPEFGAEEFDERKYTEYFPNLQAAYKQAFERVNERHDSELVHALDQAVLSESEPFYDPNEGFTVEVPAEPAGRVAATGVMADTETIETVLAEYVEEIESALASEFAPDSASEPKG